MKGTLIEGNEGEGNEGEGNEGEGNESYEIRLCSSLKATSSFSFLTDLKVGEFDLEGVRGSTVVFVVGV